MVGIVQRKLGDRKDSLVVDSSPSVNKPSSLLGNGVKVGSVDDGRDGDRCSFDDGLDGMRFHVSIPADEQGGDSTYERTSHGRSRNDSVSSQVQRPGGEDVSTRSSNGGLNEQIVGEAVGREIRDESSGISVGEVSVRVGEGDLDGGLCLDGGNDGLSVGLSDPNSCEVRDGGDTRANGSIGEVVVDQSDRATGILDVLSFDSEGTSSSPCKTNNAHKARLSNR